MNTTEGIVIIFAILAIIAIAAFFIYRQHGSAEIKGPFSFLFKFRGTNEPPPPKAGISGKDITSREGGLVAKDTTGHGIELDKVDVKTNIRLSSENKQNHQLPEKSLPQNIGGTLSANALSAGGDININQFINSDSSSIEQLVFFLKQIGLEKIHSSPYAQSQYQAYCDVLEKSSGPKNTW